MLADWQKLKGFLKKESAVLTSTSHNRDNLPVEFDFSPLFMIGLWDVCLVFGSIVCILLYSHLVKLEISAIKQKPLTGQAFSYSGATNTTAPLTPCAIVV